MNELEFHIGLYRSRFTEEELKNTELLTIYNSEDLINGLYELRMTEDDMLLLVEYSMGVLTFSAYIYKVGVDRENEFIIHSKIWFQHELEVAFGWLDNLFGAKDVANTWLVAISLGDVAISEEERAALTEFFTGQRRIAYEKLLNEMHGPQLSLFRAYQKVLSDSKPDPKSVIFDGARMPDVIPIPNDTDVPDAFKEYMQ